MLHTAQMRLTRKVAQLIRVKRLDQSGSFTAQVQLTCLSTLPLSIGNRKASTVLSFIIREYVRRTAKVVALTLSLE